MSEFQIQQLIIASRWEFDVPMLMLIVVSMGFMAISIFRPRSLDLIVVRLSQLVYTMVAMFLFIRAYAAILRTQKLGGLLADTAPLFEVWTPAIALPTLYLRIGTFVVLLLATLYLLNRTRFLDESSKGA